MVGPSISTEQQAAESLIRDLVAAEVGVDLEPKSLLLRGGARVDVDGVGAENSVLVEIFAHQGPLKGSQVHKVARDALKLITLGRGWPQARLIVAFADAEAANGVTGKSWLAEALRTWGVEVLVVELDAEVLAGLREAQRRQVMVNPPSTQAAAEPRP